MSLLNSVINQIKLPDPPIAEIWTPMNWRETSEAHVFEISLPGVMKEEVKLEVHQGSVLRIIAERKEEEEEDEKGGIKWHCKERLNGQMKREFRLPENVKSEEIKASMRDGLLVVIVPKDKMKKKAAIKLKSVDISGDGEETDHRKGIGRFICCKA